MPTRQKAVALVLFGLVTALGVLGCEKGKDQDGQPPVSERTPPPPASTDRVAPVEATTTQGSKVVFPGGDISWADAVVSFTPGDPAPKRSGDPSAALGKPDYQGTDDAKDEATYVSLGHGGDLVLELTDNLLVDGEGPDLAIFEIGPEVEPILVAISEEGKDWINADRVEGATCVVDIAPFVKPGQRFRFVKLTDAEAAKSNDSEWPGADVDAVGAINTSPTVPAERTK
jgi:OOP family OmpA-OmpF porin